MAKTSTKKALLMSVLSLMLCISMLIGTTFAWFTDSVSSTNNIIKSGRLDVELEYSTDAANWTPVTDTTNIFKDGALWEPGYTEVVYLRVSNKGNLALKYSLGVNIASEIGSTNVNGKEFKLSEFIYFGTKEGAVAYADRDAAIADVAAGAKKISAGYSKSSFLNTQGASEIVTMVVYMPTYVNNDANYAEGEAVPTIKLGLNLFATQKDFEKDGFNTNDYDVSAEYLNKNAAGEWEIGTVGQLFYFAQSVNAGNKYEGETVILTADIDLNGYEWTPIGTDVNQSGISFNGIFDGRNHTVSNIKVTNRSGWNGLFGLVGKGSSRFTESISNLTVKNVEIVGANRMSGGIVGQIYGNVENCHVENIKISATPNWIGTQYDNGDKIGGIAGWHGDNNNNHYIKGCTVKNATFKAYRDVAGISGYIARSSTVANCSVDTLSITVDQATNHYGLKPANANAFVGKIYGDPVTVENNTGTNVSIYAPTFATPATVQDAINAAASGDSIVLVKGEYHNAIVVKSGITLIGSEGAVVDCINLNGSDGVTLKDIEFDAAGAQLSYNGKGKPVQAANIISGDGDNRIGAKNLVIDGCTFGGTFADGGVVIAFTDQSRSSGTSGNITIKNCVFQAKGGYVDIYTYYSGGGYLNIENNTFASECINQTIYLGRYQSSVPVVVKGNHFVKKASFSEAALIQAHSGAYTVSFDESGNTFGA